MYIDSANINDITESIALGIIKGVTTNPLLLHHERVDEVHVSENLKDTKLIIYFQLKGIQSIDFLDYFYGLKKKLKEPFGIKIPMSSEGIKTISYIKEHHPTIPILATAVYTANQGIVAAMMGCTLIAPYYNRIAQEGGDPVGVIRSIRSFIDSRDLGTQIVAASFKSTKQIESALLNGAHTCTIPFKFINDMVINKASNTDILEFNAYD